MLNYIANIVIKKVRMIILMKILNEFIAAGTGLLDPSFVEKTGATPETGANNARTIIFLTITLIGNKK